MEPNDHILLIKTVQISPFRILMTALKDILLETNITFEKDSAGKVTGLILSQGARTVNAKKIK